jgi:hypothetical protein
LIIGDGERGLGQVQEAFLEVATKDFFSAEVLIPDWATLMLAAFQLESPVTHV